MAKGIRDKVAILGMGCSKFGERWDKEADNLMVEAYTEAIADAGIDAGKVGGDGSNVRCGDFKAPPQKDAGTIIEDEDTDATVAQIVAWLDERKLIA